MTVFVGFTIPDGMVEKIDGEVKRGQALSRSEWIRQALVKRLNEIEEA